MVKSLFQVAVADSSDFPHADPRCRIILLWAVTEKECSVPPVSGNGRLFSGIVSSVFYTQEHRSQQLKPPYQ